MQSELKREIFISPDEAAHQALTEPMEPLDDVVLTKIFENKETSGNAILSIINAVRGNAGETPVTEVIEQSTQRTFAEVDGRRGARLDVLVKTADNHVVNIEVQRRHQKAMNDRSLFYGAKLLNEATEKSLAIESMINELPQVMMVNLLDFSIRPDHEDFHQPVRLLYDKLPYERASELFAIHHIDLVRFRKINFDIQNPLHRWLRMLIEGYKNPQFAEEVCKMDAGLQQFAERYNMVATDKHTRDEYFRYKMALYEQRRELADAREEGLTQGRIERIVSASTLYKKTGNKELVTDVFPDLNESDWQEIMSK